MEGDCNVYAHSSLWMRPTRPDRYNMRMVFTHLQGWFLGKLVPMARDFLQKVDPCLGISRAQIRLLSPVVYSQFVIIRVDIFIKPVNTLLGGNKVANFTVQSAERFINKQRSQIGHPCPGAFIENVDPCLGIFQWKVVPMSRDFLQKTDPKGRNVPVCLNMWVPPGTHSYCKMCSQLPPASG